jgi:hypothetical protein
VIAGLLVGLIGVALIAMTVIRRHNGERHARCLRNIDRLEVELGIAAKGHGHVPVDAGGKVEWLEIGPGQRWTVDEADDIAALNHMQIFHAYGLLASGEAKRVLPPSAGSGG